MEHHAVPTNVRPSRRNRPVANFSLPRLEGVPNGPCREIVREESDRRSLNSGCSTSSLPGMIEDHDSEASGEDDLTVQPSDLADSWDSYWFSPSPGDPVIPSHGSTSSGSQWQPASSALMWLPGWRKWRSGPPSETRSEPTSRSSPQPGQLPRSDSGDSVESYNWPLPPVPAQFYKRQEARSRRRSRWRPKQAKARHTIFRQDEPVPVNHFVPGGVSRASSVSRPQTAGSSTASGPSEPANSSPPVLVARPFTQPKSPPSPQRGLSTIPSSVLAQHPGIPTRSAPPTPLPPFSASPDPEGAGGPRQPPPKSARRRPSLLNTKRPATAKDECKQEETKTYRDQAQKRYTKSQPYLPISPTEDLLPHYQDSPPLPPLGEVPPHEALRSHGTSDLVLESIPELHLQHPRPHRTAPALPPSQSISVFELDSDNESTYSDEPSVTLARRIVRGFTGHKRSASETKRTGRGDEAAQAQLRRARAETASITTPTPTSTSTSGAAGSTTSVNADLGPAARVSSNAPDHGGGGGGRQSPRETVGRAGEDGPAVGHTLEAATPADEPVGAGPVYDAGRPQLRRQGSHMLGRLFGRRSQ